MSRKNKTLVIIDSHALIHRAYHALPPLTSKDGQPMGAVYGFISSILKLLEDLKPDYIAAAFDLPGPTIRHEQFKEYKATRPETAEELKSQFSLCRVALEGLGISVFEKEGYEADDVIGSLAETVSRNPGIDILIMTGDLDTLQLIKPGVRVYTFKRGMSDVKIYGAKEVRERYGGLVPSQMVDYKGLKGDPSDNIPGAPGIGDKTAIAILKTYNNIENLYKKLPGDTTLKPRIKNILLENKDLVFFSKELVTIERTLLLGAKLEDLLWETHYDVTHAREVFHKLGFFRLLERLPEAKEEAAKDEPRPDGRGGVRKEKELKDNSTFSTFEKELGTAKLLVLSKAPFEEAFVIDTGKTKYVVRVDGISCVFLAKIANLLFVDAPFEFYAHDLKDILRTILLGLDTKTRSRFLWDTRLWFDSMLASWVLDSEWGRYELKRVFFEELGSNIPQNPTYEQYQNIKEILEKKLREKRLWSVFSEIELPLLPVLAEMEVLGIRLAVKELKTLSKTFSKSITRLKKKIFKISGVEFNTSSPVELRRILFEKLALPTKGLKKTPLGVVSTAAQELELVRETSPIIDLILELRELVKLKTTYTDSLPKLVRGKKDRIHTRFNQTGTATGRLSSSDPNLQNIPTRSLLGKKIRSTFVAESGYTLVSFDYSQIELRIAAALSGDTKMLDTFKKKLDIHELTASDLYNVSRDQVTKEMRDHSKIINFGIIYGISVTRFAKTANISFPEAKQFIAEYKNTYPQLTVFLEDCKEEARDKGYAQTHFGRKRFLPEIHSPIHERRRAAERMAANMPIQGTEADIIKQAMVELSEYIKEHNLQDDVRMLVQIHDELLFEIKNDIIQKEVSNIQNIMERVSPFSNVTLNVDVRVGNTWGNMVQYT